MKFKFYQVFLFTSLFWATHGGGQQKEGEFDSIKDLLKNDQLSAEKEKKAKELALKKEKLKKLIDIQKQAIEDKRKAESKQRQKMNRFPKREEFWGMMSELYLVKKAPKLRWDIKKPDYGLNLSFEKFLEGMGHFEQKFKLLLLDTPVVPHYALPSNPNEFIVLLSLPFIRTLDLTKLEISVLLFENFIRSKMGMFLGKIDQKKINSYFGSNLLKKKFDTKIIDKILSDYDAQIFEKGFSFQEQYNVTKQMDSLLKSNMKYWNAYIQLLKKIDGLVKSNALYRNYSKIYPSPELQLSWLIPKGKS